MFRLVSVLAALSVTACGGSSATLERGGAGDLHQMEARKEGCSVKMDFSKPDSVARWQIVNDGVMGGRSQGTRFAEDGHMVFQGTINTNGGGFSSVRQRMAPGDLAGSDGIRLKLRTDGRAYKMTFRTSERFRGRSVSYQKPIPVTAPGEWAEVTVPFTEMDTSVFGFSVRAAPFDPADVREIGIILADGVDGDFRLELERLSCTTDAVQPA